MNKSSVQQAGIGIHALPSAIRNSTILTANNLAQLATIPELPVIDPSWDDDRLRNIFQYFSINPEEMEKELHGYAKELLQQEKVNEAWQVLLSMA